MRPSSWKSLLDLLVAAAVAAASFLQSFPWHLEPPTNGKDSRNLEFEVALVVVVVVVVVALELLLVAHVLVVLGSSRATKQIDSGTVALLTR